MSALVHWVATLLSAKFLAGLVRSEWGLAPAALSLKRADFSVDVVYLWLLAAFSFGVQAVGVREALLLAILLRLGVLVSPGILLAANHHFIELFAMALVLRLYESPHALGAVTQVMVLSIWAYAALQKVYHGEFLNGAFFYVMFQDSRPSNRWSAMGPWIRRVHGRYGPLDPAGLALCKRLAFVAVAVEVAGPLLAILAAGTWWGVAAMLATSIAIAYVSGESSFLITNAALAILFLVPFRTDDLFVALNDPVVAVIIGYCLCWPPLHAVLTRALRISSWKLGGWGMYATVPPRVSLINSDGRFVDQPVGTPPLAMLKLFGQCRLALARSYAHRVFLRWQPTPETIRGFVFQRYSVQGVTLVTLAEVFPLSTEVAPRAFTIADQTSENDFESYVVSVAGYGGHPNDLSSIVTLDTPASAVGEAIPNCILEET